MRSRAAADPLTVADAQRRRRADSGPAIPSPATQAAIDEGRGLYNCTCTACHGANGAAGEIGPGLAIPGRSYAPHQRRADLRRHPARHSRHRHAGAAGQADRRPDLEDRRLCPCPARHRHRHSVAGRCRPWRGDVLGQGPVRHLPHDHGRGSIIGPDLSNIAALRKTNSIIDALTKEQHRVYGAGGAQPHAADRRWTVCRWCASPRPTARRSRRAAQRGQLSRCR